MKYIHVKVVAGASRESFRPVRIKASGQESDDHFEISVKEKAERNEANVRVVLMVAEYLQVSTGKVRIVNGHHHPSKLLIIEN